MATDTRYHHGNLRQALLDAALDLAATRGIDGFTLREVARQAGVSHNAPYHHFADKASLVEAVATEGFAQLAAALRRAWEDQPGTALARLQTVGIAYVRFALEHPAAFRFMFRPELRRPVQSGAEAAPSQPGRLWEPAIAMELAARDAYQVLIDAVVAGQAEALIERGDPGPSALAAWSVVHGLAMLLIDTPSGPTADDAARMAATVEAVTAILIKGLRVG